MYKILYLPTGSFVKCPVRNVDTDELHYDFVDWQSLDVRDAEEYLFYDMELWGDLICTVKSRRMIGLHWIRKHFGDRGFPVKSEHFEIMEYPDV